MKNLVLLLLLIGSVFPLHQVCMGQGRPTPYAPRRAQPQRGQEVYERVWLIQGTKPGRDSITLNSSWPGSQFNEPKTTYVRLAGGPFVADSTLKDSLIFGINPTGAKLGDEYIFQFTANASAKIVKFKGNGWIRRYNDTIPANRSYLSTWHFDGNKWRRRSVFIEK